MSFDNHNPSIPSHANMDHFGIANDELMIGSSSVSSIADLVGQTPFYVYDRSAIENRVRSLRSHLPQEMGLHYAIKANPMPAVVQYMASLLDGLDVASHGELLVALDTGKDPRNISIAGPGKTDPELTSALAAGVVINVESATELTRIAKIAEATGYLPKIALRINPDFEVKKSGMRMGGGSKPFGIDSENIPQLLKKVIDYGLEFIGFQIYFGSQILDADNLISAQNQCIDLVIKLSDLSSCKPRSINLGGGFGIPYFPGENHLDVSAVSDNLSQRLLQVKSALGCEDVFLELGRYLVGEAGVFVCKIIEKKISRGKTYLVVDGGLHHNLAATGNLGQVIRKNYPVVAAQKINTLAEEEVTIVGPLCTPLDILADSIMLPGLQPGDLIAVLQAGAYGFSASPHGFLSHPPPRETLI